MQKRLWPERVELVDAIPRTESGKVRRNQLFDELSLRLAGAAAAEGEPGAAGAAPLPDAAGADEPEGGAR